MHFEAAFHPTQPPLRRSTILLAFRLPHHDLGFIVHILLVDEGDTHPETAECQKHPAEGLEVQLHVVDMDDGSSFLVVLDMAAQHMTARHPLVAPLAVFDLRTPRRDLGQGRIAAVGARTAFIEPGSPWENGYIESFNARLRDELLNGEIFYTLKEAQVLIESWRRHYNAARPHSSLGYRPPAPETIIMPSWPPGSATLRRPPSLASTPPMH